MLAFSAAGFIATSTFGMSPGVRMSWSEMWTWNDETPGDRPGGGPDLGRDSSASSRGRCRTAALTSVNRSPVELHPVAGVAGEADHDPVERLRLEVVLDGHAPSLIRCGCLLAVVPPPGPPCGPELGAEPPLHHRFSWRRRP